MARLARQAFETEVYHIMVQGINKEAVFGEHSLKSKYLYNLVNFREEFEVKLLAYCIMDTHCHILLHVPSVNSMAKYMRKVNTTFAQYYNYKNQRVGYVFRDRYKSQPIYDEKYLFTCLVYIHNNPVKAGVASDPSIYAYSSVQAYLNGLEHVDLEDAKTFFDISPENMIAAMRELKGDECDVEWIDVEEEMPTLDEKIKKAVSKYGLTVAELPENLGLLKKTIKDLSDMGISGADIGRILGISKSYVSKLLKH